MSFPRCGAGRGRWERNCWALVAASCDVTGMPGAAVALSTLSTQTSLVRWCSDIWHCCPCGSSLGLREAEPARGCSPA